MIFYQSLLFFEKGEDVGYNAMRTFFIKNDPKMCVGTFMPKFFHCESLDELLQKFCYKKDQKTMYVDAMDEDCAFDDIQIIEEKPFTIITLSNVRTINPWYYSHFDTIVMEII